MSKLKEKQGISTIGRVLSDGTVVEMIYEPKLDKSSFVVKLPNGSLDVVPQFTDPVSEITYHPQINSSIRDGLISLPSELGDRIETTSLFERTCSFIAKYVDIDKDACSIAASFAIMSHVYDKFEKVPYMRFFGPYSTGKSRALAILRSICYHPISLGGSQTPAIIYRTLDKFGSGTMFLDEANYLDTTRSSDITKILNDGYSRDGVVYRCDPKTYTPIPYRIFSPKVIGNHSSFDDPALESRMFTIPMRPSTRKDLRKPLPASFDFSEAIALRNLMLRYRFEHYRSINTMCTYDALLEFDARTQEITLPLLWAQELHYVPSYVIDYLRQLCISRRERQMLDDDAIVACIASNLKASGRSYVSLAEVRNQVFEKAQTEMPVKRIGHHLRLLGATSIRTNQGYQYNLQTINAEFLKSRYGL